MKRTKNRQYTIRAVPPAIDKALRERARREGKSLNQLVLEALRRGLGVDAPVAQFHDLDRLIGTWVDDPEFDAAIAAQDTVDEDLWR
jgi:plasmid stability protein